ncbi:hypothetical protein BHYA_0151g00130 [Botrytis hyacinthi]|uniref:Uncharacterized protein n=1 Tax=Botrytis hyacinthi TaxID=278943 RepID=A0A4Z1GJN5_9HELO|nr:hypothetical protein BHYA_0151g00130 [Botrytis hyacinthi]
MSHSNFLLDPLLLQEDERNKKTSSSSQRASSIMPETPFIEQKVPFIKQEQEEEHVYHPVSTHVGNTPDLKYEDGYKSASCSSIPVEGHDIKNNISDHLSSYQQDRKSSGKSQFSPSAQSGSFKSPEKYDQYVGDLTSLQKYQPGASDQFRPSSPQASIQTGDSESFPPSTGLQPVSSDSNRPSNDIYYDAGGVSQAQPNQYYLTHDQSPGSQTLPIQHSINENVVDNQYYSSQALDIPPVSQAPEPGLDFDEHLDLQPGVITMNLPTPATIQEVEYLQSWIPRNKLDIENFYAARPGLNQPILENSSKQDQNPEHACELQRQGYLAFPSPAISQALSYSSIIPHSGIRKDDNRPIHNNYEEIGGPDVETVKEWGGIKHKINNKGAYHEVLHRRRTTIGAKYHPEADQMMALPYSTGENLTDRDILQLARLSPFERHLRASKFFNERGEFYTRHIRFTEMSDARLRREGLLRSWIPRKAGDRPHNSVERAARAAQLGLTGDDKLIADAAAERLRRAAAEKKMRESKAA